MRSRSVAHAVWLKTSHYAFGALLVAATGTAAAQTLPCAPPTALRADSVGQLSAVVRFAGAADARGYRVTTDPATSTYLLTGGQTAVRLRGLFYDTNYTVSVAQQCADNQYSAAAKLLVHTAEYCSGPNDVQPVNITSTSADILFGPGAPGTARDYTVVVDLIKQGISSTEVARYTATSSPLRITGLLPSSLYGVTFFTNCTNGQSSGGTGGPGNPFTTLPATTTGTAAQKARAGFVVYPNPARATAAVRLPSTAPAGEYVFSVLDATGRVVQTQTTRYVADQVIQLALAPGPAGLYVLRAEGPAKYRVNAPLVRE